MLYDNNHHLMVVIFDIKATFVQIECRQCWYIYFILWNQYTVHNLRKFSTDEYIVRSLNQRKVHFDFLSLFLKVNIHFILVEVHLRNMTIKFIRYPTSWFFQQHRIWLFIVFHPVCTNNFVNAFAFLHHL